MNVETVRCARCSVYTPDSDIVVGRDGRPYCDLCAPHAPPPGAAPRAASAAPSGPKWNGGSDWEEVPRFRSSPLDRTARIAAMAMVLLTLAFPIAACLSQL